MPQGGGRHPAGAGKDDNAAAHEKPPSDLALLDINRPGESGFAFCRKLRQQAVVPVICLSARESAEDELVGFGVGADDYIRGVDK